MELHVTYEKVLILLRVRVIKGLPQQVQAKTSAERFKRTHPKNNSQQGEVREGLAKPVEEECGQEAWNYKADFNTSIPLRRGFLVVAQICTF